MPVEAFGLPSIWEAVQLCGADRLGHGVRIIDDLGRSAAATGGRRDAAARARPGGLGARPAHPARAVPVGNVQTGAAPSVGEHPITMLKELGFGVTVNTDNRLMSATSPTRELELLAKEAGWTLTDARWVTINALKSAFIPFDERLGLIEDVVKPGYAALGLPR